MNTFFLKIKHIFTDDESKFLLHAKAMKRIPRSIAVRIFIRALQFKESTFTYFWDATQKSDLEFVRDLFRDNPISMSLAEAYQIYMTVGATGKIVGDIAEVGVYKGGTAKVICTAKGDKTLHLFDTFGEGLPEPDEHDDEQWYKGAFKLADSEFDAIKRRLSGESNVLFYQGMFPDTSGPVKNKQFSFVHLDVDIYRSTLDCLDFFYPRMSKGGVIISHDYHGAAGVKKAFQEFFENKPEAVILLSTSQCIVIKS